MIAKIAVFCAVLVAVQANGLGLIHHGAIMHTGSSVSSRQQDGHGNYAFNYKIADGKGATNSRSEVGDGAGNKKGSYSLTDVDGRARVVEYVADGHGFRAAVKTNEPGTAASAPAAAIINSPYAAPVAPVHAVHGLAPLALHAVAAPSAYSTSIVHGAAMAPLAHSYLGVGHLGLGVGHLGLGYGKGHLL